MTDYERYGDYRPHEGGSLSLALTFLCLGIGAGALAALMLAPKTGRNMRRMLRRRYEDAREAVGDFSDNAGKAIERGTDYANAVRQRVEPIGRALNRRRW